MPLFFFLMTFIFGTFVGSFLNVIIFRFNTGKTAGGRSKCMNCGKTLGLHELVPVFSYCVQGGKCRNCKSSVSMQYPIVEAIMGFIFALVFWKFRLYLITDYPHFVVLVSYVLAIFSILLVVFFYDLRHKIIPNSLCVAFIILSFFAPFILNSGGYQITYLTFLSGPIVSLPLLLLWLYSRGRWIGFGDVKLALGIGYFLGVSGGFAALMLSFWSGAIIGLVLLWMKGKKYGMKSEIPFAPFMIIGFALAFLLKIDLLSLSTIFMR